MSEPDADPGDFEWREAKVRRSTIVIAFVCGAALSGLAGWYLVQSGPVLSGGVTVSKADPSFAVSQSTFGEPVEQRRDTTAIFEEPDTPAKDDKKDEAAKGTEPAPQQSAAPSQPPAVPTVINRDTSAPEQEDKAQDTPEKRDNPPAPVKEAARDSATDGEERQAAKRRTPPAPSPSRPSGYERESRFPPPPVPVDPSGRDQGYWNGRDFN